MKPYYQDESVTIYHGDCREILPLLGRGVIITDPPYGCGIKYGALYDDSPKTYWEWFLPCVDMMKTHSAPVVFTHRNAALRYISGWDWVGVWNKPGSFGSRIGNSCVLPHWEPIFMFGIHGLGTKSLYTSDVFTFNPNNNGAGISDIGRAKWKDGDFPNHPTPKPRSLFVSLIKAFAQNDETLIDPFCGSGVTLRAAKELGRKVVGIEIEERYCEESAKRMSQEILPFAE